MIKDKAQMKEEALKRMRKMQLSHICIDEFIIGKVLVSEQLASINRQEHMLFTITDNEKRMIEGFEKDYGVLVYHIIHNYAPFGELYNLFYVSNESDDWKLNNQDISRGLQRVYVINRTIPEYSEFGTISFKKRHGCLIRIS